MKKHKKKLIIAAVLLPLLIAGSVGAWFLWKSNQVVAQTGVTGTVVDILEAEALAGEETGRVNILLAGNSSDDAGHSGALLTDSILIMSIDVVNNTSSIASIPRDMWVNIPGNGYAKINTAYSYGETQQFSEAGYSAGGMGLLEKTIETTLGVPINYTTLINYAAFKETIDLVGGIDISIESSDPRGIYDPNIRLSNGSALTLSNGTQHLDGETALALARARNLPVYGQEAYGLPNGDYDRSMYQRKMLIALIQKLTEQINIADVNELLTIFGSNVEANFSVGNIRRLYDFSKLITVENTTQIALTGDNALLVDGTSSSGQWILEPRTSYEEIAQTLQTILAPAVADNSEQ